MTAVRTASTTRSALCRAIFAAAIALGALGAAAVQAGERLDRIAETKTLRVGTPADYRPFAMKEADGRIAGHDADVIEAMARTAGWKVEYIVTPWKDLEAGIKGDRFDVAVGGITQTLARAGYAAFLPGYAPFGKVALVSKKNKDRFTTLESLNDPSVRVIKNPGGTNEQFVLEHLNKAQISTHDKNFEIPEMIARGEGDVMITETAEAKLYVKKYPELHAAFLDHPLTPVSEMGFMLPTDDADYLRSMQFLWRMLEIRGELKSIEAKWLD